MDAINLTDKLTHITEHWSPRIIAQLNNLHFKLAKIEGEFIWHSHEDTDEAFFVVKGQFDMQYRDRTVTAREGDLVVVPKGVEHRPVATEECQIMLVELAGTVNTGEEGGDLTAANDKWI